MPMTSGTAYQWHGENADDKPVVVLIHGLGLNSMMWQWQVPAFTGRYRVLTYDLYGHGNSLNAPGQPDLQLFAEQLVDLLDAMRIDHCFLAGFSLGGMIARRFAMDYGSRLDALVIMHSPHTRTDSDQSAIEKRVAMVGQSGPASTVEAAIERWFGEGFRQQQPETIDQVRRWVLANDPHIYPDNYRVLATGITELIAPDPPIDCPTLVITSDQDSGQPAHMAQAIASEIPGAEIRIFNNLRHMAPVEKPELYNNAMTSFFNRICDATTGADVG